MMPHPGFQRGSWLLEGEMAYVKRSLDAIENSVALTDHREFFRCGHGSQRIFMTSQLVGGRGGTNS